MIDVPILVKDALRDGRRLKNYRILVLNDDGTTDFVIDNDTLVSETVDIDERMCSGDTIKFGLCEGSSLEFQYFDHPSIYGRQLNVFVDVWSDYIYRAEDPTWHDIKTLTETDGTFTVVEPGTYKIDYIGPISFEIEWTRNGVTYHDEIFPISGEQSFSLGDLVAGDTIRAFTEYFQNTFSVDLKGYYEEGSHWYPVPMGFFTVEKCSKQASTGIKKVTAYNKLQSAYLDAKANSTLLEDFDGDATTEVTVYDIEKHLLENYAIFETPKIAESFEGASAVGRSGSILGVVTWGTHYANVKTPFSACEFYGKQIPFSPPSGQIMYFSLSGMGREITVPEGDYWELAFIKGDFDVLVQNMVDSIVDAIYQKLGGPGSASSREALEADVRDALKMTFLAEITLDGHTETYYFSEHPSETLKEINDLPNKKGPSTIKVAMPLMIGLKTQDEYLPRCRLRLSEDVEYSYYVGDSAPYQSYETDIWPAVLDSEGDKYEDDMTKYFVVNHLQLSDAEKVTFEIADIPDFTLRDITSASYETVCQFGKLDRVTDLFSGVELNNSRLFPAEDLYPDDSLYPDGAALSSEKSMYSKLWADEGNIQKWRNLIITYKGLDENNQEKDFTLERQINADGTQDYNMSDNWLFKNLIWTASQVGDYADAMVAKMQDMTWFPFEMWCAGLPYLETGDELEISIGQTSYTSYVLQRQLKGIQNLQDTYINGTLDIF